MAEMPGNTCINVYGLHQNLTNSTVAIWLTAVGAARNERPRPSDGIYAKKRRLRGEEKSHRSGTRRPPHST